jgi:hypothetical protein
VNVGEEKDMWYTVGALLRQYEDFQAAKEGYYSHADM